MTTFILTWLSGLFKDPELVLATVASFSGLFQAFGYLVYIRKSFRHELEPNPTTWFMFAYGTAFLTVLEYDRQASWPILILPVTCAILSVRVAAICIEHGKPKWPKHWLDRTAFLMDLSLTAAYVIAGVLSKFNFIDEGERGTLVLAFLALSNTSTIVSFIPILRETIEDPRTEHPLPWLIWTTAYACLAYVTYVEAGNTIWSIFMLYPATGIMLHGLVGLLALRRFMQPALHP